MPLWRANRNFIIMLWDSVDHAAGAGAGRRLGFRRKMLRRFSPLGILALLAILCTLAPLVAGRNAQFGRRAVERRSDRSAAKHGQHGDTRSNLGRAVRGLFEDRAAEKEALMHHGAQLRKEKARDRALDGIRARRSNLDSGSDPRRAQAYESAQRRDALAVEAKKNQKLMRSMDLEVGELEPEPIVPRDRLLARQVPQRRTTARLLGAAARTSTRSASRTRTRSRTPTSSQAAFTLSPVATLVPRPAAPVSAPRALKAFPTDTKIAQAPQPSVHLVSDTSFSLVWGSRATDRSVSDYSGRFWNSGASLSGYLVECFPAASLGALSPTGPSKSFVTPLRAIQVELTATEATSRFWTCRVKSIGRDGAESLGRTVGVDLAVGTARSASLKLKERLWDFNVPLSYPTGMETHHSLCADPQSTASWVTAGRALEFTVRSRDSPLCPAGSPAWITVKPLHTLDFRGRTAEIGFEAEGVADWHSTFGLTLSPVFSSDSPGAYFATGLSADRQYPFYGIDSGDFLRLEQVANRLVLSQKWSQLASVALDAADLDMGIPGLRRAIVVRVSTTRVQVVLSGRTIMDSAVSLSWDRAQPVIVLSTNSTGNPSPAPLSRTSIDNLWFGGSLAAAQQSRTVVDFPVATFANYRAVLPGQQAAFKINLTADPTLAITAALHFSFHDFPSEGGNIYDWYNAVCILRPGGPAVGTITNLYGQVGARAISCRTPPPSAFIAPTEQSVLAFGVPDNYPGSWILRLDPSWLARGVNTFVFDFAAAIMVGDIHLELSFAQPPVFVPPMSYWLLPSLPANPRGPAGWLGKGPGARLSKLANLELWRDGNIAFTSGVKVGAAMLKVEFEVFSDFAGTFVGPSFASRGIGKVEILINGNAAKTFSYPGLGVGYIWERTELDLANWIDWSAGMSQAVRIEVRPYDADGNRGFPVYEGIGAYAKIGAWQGKSLPLLAVVDLGTPTTLKGVRVFSATTTTVASVPIPSNLVIVPDERVATLSWDGPGPSGFVDYGARFWQGVSGYQVSWYPLSNRSAVSRSVTPNRAIQLQPLAVGVTYGVYVQTVDAEGDGGRLSAPSVEVTFASDSSRVNELRRTMTGFFDDFNLAAGQFDPTKWVTSYSVCSDPIGSANFINGQVHAHNGVKTSGRCPSSNKSDIYAAMVTSRAMGVCDFTGTTGTIVLDFDGPSESNYWFLDLVPDPDEDRFSFSGPSIRVVNPPDPIPDGALRLHAAGNKMSLDVDSSQGSRVLVPQFDVKSRFGIDFTPNMRRPFVIKISKNTFSLDISGVRVMDVTGLGLPFERGSLRFQQFANVTNANVIPVVTTHWDNLGCTSVSGKTRVTRQYRATNSATYRLVGPTLPDAENTFVIAMPDSIAGAKAARVKFSRQGDANSNWLFWSGSPIICFNSIARKIYGTPTTCHRLVTGTSVVDRTIGEIEFSDPHGVIFELPVSSIRPVNNLVIQLPANMYIGDVLLELDYPPNWNGTYTPPQPWFGNLTGPSFHPSASIQVGPTARLTKIGDTILWRADGLSEAMKTPGGIPVTGTMLTIEGEVDSTVGLQAFGRAFGIIRIELQVDKKTVQTWTFPAPGVPYYYVSTDVDVSGLALGVHEVFILAYESTGMISIPAYDFPSVLHERPMYFGSYIPARFTIM